MDRRQLLTAAIIGYMARFSLEARATAAGNASDDQMGVALDAEWLSLAFTLFPHERLELSLYSPCVAALKAAIAKDAATRALMTAGWQQLRLAIPVAWSDASSAQRHQAVRSLSTDPFFSLLRRTIALTLYGNPQVWSAFSYDGDAWHMGGWLGRPEFGVLGWLPDPPKPDFQK